MINVINEFISAVLIVRFGFRSPHFGCMVWVGVFLFQLYGLGLGKGKAKCTDIQ